MKDKGFTLIELLVVVALIAIIASFVMARLGASRDRAKDAAVASSLSNYRTQAEVDFTTGDYTGLCRSENYEKIGNYVVEKGGEITECRESTIAYRVVASLPSTNTS